jgi:hypothetical protein
VYSQSKQQLTHPDQELLFVGVHPAITLAFHTRRNRLTGLSLIDDSSRPITGAANFLRPLDHNVCSWCLNLSRRLTYTVAGVLTIRLWCLSDSGFLRHGGIIVQ